MITFSFKRFLLLLKKDFTENIRVVISTILIALFITLVLIVLEILNSPISIINLNKSLKIYYLIGLIILGAGFAGFSFSALRKTEKSINYLLLPASTLEKFLSYLILSLFGFFLIYSIMFFLFSFSTIYIYNIIHPDNLQLYFNIDKGNDILGIFSGINRQINIFAISIYLNLNALFLLGAITFKRSQHFITAFIASITTLSFFVIVAFIGYLLKSEYYALTGPVIEISSNGASKIIDIYDVTPIIILKHLLIYGLALFLYYIGYLKLKEKEV